MTSIEAVLASLGPATAALAVGVVMAAVTCYLAVTAGGRESTSRSRALVASAAMCGLAVVMAVAVWLLEAGTR